MCHTQRVSVSSRKRLPLFGWAIFIALAALLVVPSLLAEKPPVSVTDCVSLRRIFDGPQAAPNGASIAYVVKHPNTKTNQNEYEIRVRPIPGSQEPDNGRLIASYREPVTGLRWLSDNRHLVFLLNPAQTMRKESRIVEIDTVSGLATQVAIDRIGITEYSASADGRTIAYLSVSEATAKDDPLLDKNQVARGFALPSDFGDRVWNGSGAVLAWEGVGGLRLHFSREEGAQSVWASHEVELPRDALNDDGKESDSGFAYALSLAPDGRFLAFTYRMKNPPESWMKSRTVRAYLDQDGVMPHGLALYDLTLRRFVDVPKIPFPRSVWWSENGHAFTVISAAPIGTKWETADAAAGEDPLGALSFHLFAFNIETTTLSEVLAPSATVGGAYSIISWQQNPDQMTIEYDQGRKIEVLSRSNDEWVEKSDRSESLPAFPLTGTRRIGKRGFIGIHEGPVQPPDIWYVNEGEANSPRQVTSLNPQVSKFGMGSLEEIHWTNRYGARVTGKLLLPPGANGNVRYPLVIMLTWPNQEFLCDCQYSTAFAPQPLASAGFAVAIFNVYNAFAPGRNEPSGPPMIKEAKSTMSSAESLVQYLDGRGLIDKNKVGIVGFSRSSWKVDYLITHSSMHFAAASSADGGIGDYGMTWLDDYGPSARMIETSYGGPFAGRGRDAWLNGAPALNADKVSSPLLMEYTGMEGLTDQPRSAYEFHSALLSLGKPVELYFYPKGTHPLDSPFERVASLQRNVDWFKFWMLGLKGKAPDYDPDQFLRWEKLKTHPSTDAPQ
jgi:dipeptidyl aminopeptidase/acylaminoacyl peptidase